LYMESQRPPASQSIVSEWFPQKGEVLRSNLCRA
jgi:hypothetical protein